MNWKPEETDIIDYLYGSMSSETREKFETYMKTHPEITEEINQIRQTLNLLPAFQDEEVIVPMPFMSTKASRPTSRRHWVFPVSIAASIAIILLTGYFTNFRMSFNQGGFTIGFVEPLSGKQELTEPEIDRMIAAGIENYANQVNGQLASLEHGFERQLDEHWNLTTQEITQIKNAPKEVKLDEAQVLNFLSQLQDENEKMMQDFYLVTVEEQKTYLRNILLEYANYLEQQRQEDRQFYRASLLDMKNDSELKQEATDKILANIIATVNNQNLPINNNQSLD